MRTKDKSKPEGDESLPSRHHFFRKDSDISYNADSLVKYTGRTYAYTGNL